MRQLSRPAYVWGWLACALFGYGALGVLQFLPRVASDLPVWATWLLLGSALVALGAGWAILAALVWQMWAVPGSANTHLSPERAAGCLFIPVFSVYWSFRVLWDWTRAYNNWTGARCPAKPRMPEGLALTVALVGVGAALVGVARMLGSASAASTLSAIALALLLGQSLLLAGLMARLCDGVNAILASGPDDTSAVGTAPAPVPNLSRAAIWSAALGAGALGTGGVAGLIGLPLGIRALRSIRRGEADLGGRGLAIPGVVLSIVSVVVGPLLVWTQSLVTPGTERDARVVVAMCNARLLCMATWEYRSDEDNHVPPGETWTADLASYLGYPSRQPLPERLLAWPSDKAQQRMWALNAHLAGHPLGPEVDAAHTVLFFEVRPGSPPSGGPELLPDRPRSGKGYLVAFVDGHIAAIAPKMVAALVWEPPVASPPPSLPPPGGPVVRRPEEPAVVSGDALLCFTCGCGNKIAIFARYAGTRAQCLRCERTLTIPAPEECGVVSPERVAAIEQGVRQLIADQLSVSMSRVKRESRLEEDLHADVLHLAKIFNAVEDTFEISIADDDLDNLTTVFSLITYVAWQEAAAEDE